MKKFLVLLTTICVFMSVISKAQTCQSAFSTIAGIFDDSVDDIIDFEKEVAEFILESKTGGASDAVDAEEVLDAAADLQKELWKNIKDNWGTACGSVGPIYLQVPTKKLDCNGLYTERTIRIIGAPYDKVKITVKKTGGRRGINMKACSFYTDSGSVYDTKTRSIDTGKSSSGETRTFTFYNQSDKYISLHLVASGAIVTNKAEYEVKVEGFIDEETIEEIDEKYNTPETRSGAEVITDPSIFSNDLIKRGTKTKKKKVRRKRS